MSFKSEATLASISGITVKSSPYMGLDLYPHRASPEDQWWCDLLVKFVQAPMVLDEFGNDHSRRKAFWKHHESSLPDDDRSTLRHNPLKWGGYQSLFVYLVSQGKLELDVPLRRIEEYGALTLEEKIDYIDRLRQVSLEKLL